MVIEGLTNVLCQQEHVRCCRTAHAKCVLLKIILADLQTSLSHAEMLRLYRSASVYVSSFRSEGFGLGTLEALALGLQACDQSTTVSVEHEAMHTCG